MVSTLVGLLGPIIGGVLFGAFGIIPILFISVGCFVFSAVMEIFIHIPYENDGKSIFGAMCASTMFSVTMMTAAQQQTPPLLGKTMAVIIAVSSYSKPVGQAVYGVLFLFVIKKCTTNSHK